MVGSKTRHPWRKVKNIHSMKEAKNIVFMNNKDNTSFSWLPTKKQRRKGMKSFCCLPHHKENEYDSQEIEQSTNFLLDSKCKSARKIMAGLLDSVAGNLLGRISEAAGRPEFSPIRNELRNLDTIVSNLKAGLRDAEEKKATDVELYDLLKQLKHAFSMADDLIEELECEYLKWKVQYRKNEVDEKVRQFSSCFFSNFLVSASKTAAEINVITKKLDMIVETMYKFHLVEDENEHIKRLKSEMTLRTSITGSQVFSRLLHLKKEAILSDNVDSIIGRDEAKQSIIDELVNDGDDRQNSRAILSIHGDGGMGKTALAKLVYNAHQVFDHFDKRMWVCVSDDFEVQRIRREILSSATGEKVTDALIGRRLLIRLERNFVGRRFLLVLDDFGAFDPGRVLELEKLVKMGAKGSKIIITTRSVQTLNDATSTTHKIERLDEKKSMVLFEHTFLNKKSTENIMRIQSEVKEKLVPKCGGSPLAIKCLAGLLSSEASDGIEWLNVKDLSEKWIQKAEVKGGCVVLRALTLSYDLMPSYLKPCFLCFSLLPKDYVFFSFELIQLWMAQGILHSDSKDPEAIGEQYFNELWYRGLLEDVEEHALGYWFKIHRLVHDLAVQQSNKEQKNLESLHQLSFFDCNNRDLSPSTSNAIRFLSIPVGGVEPKINGVPLVKCISKFRQLRVLYLCNSSLEKITTSIDTLKHLRYLDLRGNRRIKRLPESICKLQSLQTLILAFCSELEELPRNMKNLISLRFLWIHTKQASLGKDGIGSLTSLRFLAIGGSKNLSNLFEDIDKLNSLQTLIIYDCKSLLTLPKGLKSLSSLCNMAIWQCEQLRFTFSLELLRLKKLILRGLPTMATLPTWINNSDENLEVLEVGEFSRLRILPDWLSNLWELRILGISNCPMLEDCIPYNLKYCDKMKELRISFCGSLSKKNMVESNHKNLDISHISTIYVDSKKIRPQLTITDEREAAGGAGQTEAVEHGVAGKGDHESDADYVGLSNDGDARVGSKHDGDIHGLMGVQLDGVSADGCVGTGQIVGGKFDGDIHGLIGVQPNGVAEDGRNGAGQSGGGKHDGATNNDNHLEVAQTVRATSDGATNNSHVGAGQTTSEKLGDIDDSHVGIGHTVGVKLDGVANDSHVEAEQSVGAKQDSANDDSRVRIGQTVGVKLDGVADDGHVEAEHSVGAKQDGANGDSGVGLGQTVRAKHEGANNDGDVGVGQTVGVKLYGVANDGRVGAEQNVSAEQDGANENGRVSTGDILREEQDGIAKDSDVGCKQSIVAKHDGATKDSDVGQNGVAKCDGENNKKQVEVGKFEGEKLGGGNDNGHARVCLGDNDNDHAGAEQAVIITFEGF